ncbi:MAG: hypothetical protein IKD78_06315 [Bacteroidales bacterium]|nr:hypothetical protein [Bacteroidales bacterium]
MEKKTKKVTITDGGQKKTFSVRLMSAMEGIDFIDHVLEQISKLDKRESTQGLSVKSVIGELLPMATYISETGDVIDTMSIGKIDTYFQNPMAVLELGLAIFEHQMVFMTESEVFRKYIPGVQKLFSLPTSDSVTQ